MKTYLRTHLGAKLFLSYLAVLFVGGAYVEEHTVSFETGATCLWRHHMNSFHAVISIRTSFRALGRN